MGPLRRGYEDKVDMWLTALVEFEPTVVLESNAGRLPIITDLLGEAGQVLCHHTAGRDFGIIEFQRCKVVGRPLRERASQDARFLAGELPLAIEIRAASAAA